MIKKKITFADFVKLDLRIGTIKEAEAVEGSQRLIKMQIDLGKEIGMRQIIAGIVKWYNPEKLIGRQVVIVVNLEPRMMMAFESQGMMLAAGDETAVLLQADTQVPEGTIVR